MNVSSNTSPDIKARARIEHAGPLLIAGFRERLDGQAEQKIPQLWEKFIARWDDIPQTIDTVGYGLCICSDSDEYFYMAGRSVWDFSGLPAQFSPFIISSQSYAVFAHDGSTETIRDTIDFAFDQWLPISGYQHAAEPENSMHFFERYGDQFNPQTGKSDIEIWLPVTTTK